MEHLDLAGVSSSSTTSSSWMMPSFDQQDAAYLSTSRQILEPIMEETSDDEETQNWSQFESAWSSESDTGSVIRIELHHDPDSVSERDFACPAKRPRHDDLYMFEENPNYRKFHRNEHFLNNDISDTYRKRFDEFCSDSDTISYNSLSRSSSLIQFESLERQLQSDLPLIGNSTPSLINFDTTDGKSLDGSLRRFDSSDRLHQTYDLDKIDFSHNLLFNGDHCKHHTKSDSGSSDTSILSHEERILKPKANVNNNVDQRTYYKGKSSVENLSEDSGYSASCTYIADIAVLKIKSKSIPDFLRYNQNMCKEEEFENHKSLEMIYKSESNKNELKCMHSKNENIICSKENFLKKHIQKTYTKIDTEYEKRNLQRLWYTDGVVHEVKNKIHTNNKRNETNELMSTYTSASLPDVRKELIRIPDNENSLKDKNDSEQFNNLKFTSVSSVSSLPNDLNLIIDNNSDINIINSFEKEISHKNVIPKIGLNLINASYNNLTLLDYSGRSYRNSLNMADNSNGNSKRNSNEFDLGKGNFLLDELSLHFDKSLSILNDNNSSSEFLNKNIDLIESKMIPIKKLQSGITSIQKPPRKNPPVVKTFDQDPTNLLTSYTKSVEKCNFDPKELSNNDLNTIINKKQIIFNRHGFVASTPNLNTHPKKSQSEDLEISSVYNSMNQLPSNNKIFNISNDNSFQVVKQTSIEQIYPDSLENINNDQLSNNIDTYDVITLNHSSQPILNIHTQIKPNENIITMKNTNKIHHEQEQQQQQQVMTNEQQVFNPKLSNVLIVATDGDGSTLSNGSPTNSNKKKFCSLLNNSQRVDSNKIDNMGFSDHKNDVLISDRVINKLNNNNNNNNNNNINLINNSDRISNTNLMPLIKEKSVLKFNGTKPAATSSTTPIGTNDQLLNKFKPKPDEKLHKNGFLSRFTSGFRFSLRRKKKSNNDQNTNEMVINKNKKKSIADGANKMSTTVEKITMKPGVTGTTTKSSDFVFIPLKGPNSNTQVKSTTTTNTQNEQHLGISALTNPETNHIILLGKPPLPKQPPRVVGVQEKYRACHIDNIPNFSYTGASSTTNNRHAFNNNFLGYTTTSQSREIDERFLDNENRNYYTKYQSPNGIINGNSGNNRNININNYNNNIQMQSDNGLISTDNQNCQKIGLIETNLDTHETIITGKTRSLMELGPQQMRLSLANQNVNEEKLNSTINESVSRRPHKSMEFLLDKENKRIALPPENELQKSHENPAALSEHQLRVQASLQRLNIPEWFKQYNTATKSNETGSYKPGSFTRKRTSDSGRWSGLNSKTTSLSSLGSQRSDRSPLLLSPTAHSHHGGQVGFSRWSTSHLNSSQTSPSVSTRGSFSRGCLNSSFISGHSAGGTTTITNSTRNSFRQPYLGWRSQEKLSQPRTPHERLASSLLAKQQQKSDKKDEHRRQQTKQEHVTTPEIQTSIKEVTSAIVHYVNDQTSLTPRSRSASPNSGKCWLESSFVGVRPVESPQTPTIDNSYNKRIGINKGASTNATDILRMNGVAATITLLPDRSPSKSASLEDVLASLLGLPTDPTGSTANGNLKHRLSTASTSNNLKVVDIRDRLRRRSEGDTQRQAQQVISNEINENSKPPKIIDSQLQLNQSHSRRVSLDSNESKTLSEMNVKCRNLNCEKTATTLNAKKLYKSCHNCSYLYCSRECRREHWDKHRKACLHSRVSNLCRQVLSGCKDDIDTLRHLSLLAHKGYLSQGRGVVRILFRSPENAEIFIKNGFQSVGEASYVRWADLIPAEMGLELYSELLRLSTEYKPDTKMLIYVAICVVSEAPGTATAPVKWERQLVSRCAKLKLCKTALNNIAQNEQLFSMEKEQPTEIIILTFNINNRTQQTQREIISTNIQIILNRRGVILRRHYPEIYQRLQNFTEGQTDRFMPVTIHPRDSQTGQGFVCIIMPVQGESNIGKLPASDEGNFVTTINVGNELLES